VLVVTRGDEALTALPDRRVEHFPQGSAGSYTGHHPADSAEAIAQIETLRREGAQFLVVPARSFWWFEAYVPFHRHLEDRYARIYADTDCVMYELRVGTLTPTNRLLDFFSM
jgi:hypothetical protein